MSYDPNIIHECRTCGRSYAIRPVEGMSHWHFYNAYCSSWCAMPSDRREQWGYVPAGDDSVFLYLLDQAKRLYGLLLREQARLGRMPDPIYWYGFEYQDAHPYRFASEFMDRVERSLFLSRSERERFAQFLFALTNDLHQGATQP